MYHMYMEFITSSIPSYAPEIIVLSILTIASIIAAFTSVVLEKTAGITLSILLFIIASVSLFFYLGKIDNSYAETAATLEEEIQEAYNIKTENLDLTPLILQAIDNSDCKSVTRTVTLEYLYEDELHYSVLTQSAKFDSNSREITFHMYEVKTGESLDLFSEKTN